ncbi:putative prophage protein [Escherichia coli]|nr:putative prophage protein [Escherichia coli]
MATSTVIPDDIKTLKSDVSKLKNDQGSYATKLYVDSKDEIVGDWSASWYQQVLPTSGAIFGRNSAQLTGRQVLRMRIANYTSKNG